MMDYRKTIRNYYDYVMPCYRRAPLVFVKAKNCKVWDAQGREFLDFFSGFAVSNVGHCHKRVVEAIRNQLDQIMNVPNNYYHEWQAQLAQLLIERMFPGKVYFCNSGTEAVESGIKFARRFGSPDRYEIISLTQSFHGRTLASLSATGQAKLKLNMGPMAEGFVQVPVNDEDALKQAIHSKTIGILVEMIQAEGGVQILNEAYLKKIESLCKEHQLLFMIDEVQTGVGRTGKFLAYQHLGLKPDIVMLAKGLAGGFPIGAVVAKTHIANQIQPGDHGSTFGGNPIACAAACAVLGVLDKEKLIGNAFLMGAHLLRKLNDFKRTYDVIKEVRGMGLLIGMSLSIPAQPYYEACIEKGLLLNVTQENVLRFAPPLTVTEREIHQALTILDEVFKSLTSNHHPHETKEQNVHNG